MVSIGTVLTKCGWHQVTAPKTYAGDIKAFAKAVPSGKTFIYALQMSIKHLALLKAFRQTVFQNRTSSSCKPLCSTSWTHKMRKITLTIATLFILGQIIGQNLIKNCSFEKSLYKQTHISQFDLKGVDKWYQPSIGTPDYFRETNNWYGVQKAKDGKYYMGFYLYDNDDYKEYIAQKLDTVLIANRNYCLSFYVSLAEKSGFAVSEIAAAFTQNDSIFQTKKILPVGTVFSCKSKDYFTLSDEWTEINIKYKATGKEKTLFIGNFNSTKDNYIKKISNKTNTWSYYYIDNVSLKLINDSLECNCR